MQRGILAVIAFILAPFLLTPLLLLAIAAGPVLATLLLIVATGLLMFGALNVGAAIVVQMARLARHAGMLMPGHRLG